MITPVNPGGDKLHARRIFLAALVFFGLLNVFLFFYGTGLVISHDEINFLYEGLRLPSEGRLHDYQHGPFGYEVAAALEMAGYCILRALGRVHSASDYLVSMLLHLTTHLRLLRLAPALAGLACLWQIYRLGLLFGGESVGALAALLCATNLTFVMMTSFYKEDVYLYFFLLTAMERAWQASEKSDRKAALLAGFAIGAAMATKYTAIFALPLMLLPFIRPGADARLKPWNLSLAMAVGAFAALALFFPFLLTDTKTVLKALKTLDDTALSMGDQWAIKAYMNWHLPNILGWILLPAGAFELLRRFKSEPRGPVLLALVPLGMILFLGLRRGYALVYFVLPVGMILFVLASSLFVRWARTSSNGWRLPLLLAPLLVVIFDDAFLPGTIKYALLLTGPDTRILARQFFESQAQPGDCVVVNFGVAGENVLGPQLVPGNTPPGHGTFTKALSRANQIKPDPKYSVVVWDWNDAPDEASACRWMILGRRARTSYAEYGLRPEDFPETKPYVPRGYEKVSTIRAFPESHSDFVWTSLDYEEFRKISIFELWKKRVYGLSFDFYRRLDR